MRYRTLGKTNEKISVLGFDTAYLPRVETEIDRKKSDEILNYGIENGMNLIDTAYSYPAEELFKGVSGEEYLGNFLLENSLRKDLFISSKMPSHLINKKDDLEDIFNKQLKNLKTDYIDFYSLDGLNEKYWNMYKTMDIYEFMDDLLSDGHIKHIGFSTNTEMDMIVDICDDYDKWEFAITELSYLTERYQSGIEGVEYISKLNCGVMAKNPLRGGGLIKNIPSEIKELWDFIEEERSPRELAFDYLFDKKEISTVLTEANTLEDLKENIKIASNSKIVLAAATRSATIVVIIGIIKKNKQSVVRASRTWGTKPRLPNNLNII